MNSPLLSVIIPVYNEEAHIDEALTSILEQSVSDLEILCVDDGSTDSTAQIVSARARQDERVRLFCQPNLGSGPARNKALEESKGEYVAFIDGDDYLPTNEVYQTLIDVARRFGVDACCGHIVHDIDGTLSSTDSFRHYARPQLMSYIDYQMDYGYTKYVFKRQLITRNEISFPALRRFQDPPFLARALYSARRFAYAAIPSYCYRRQNKPSGWSYEQARDYSSGVLDLMEFSRQHRLAKLHNTQLTHIENNWYENLITHARNDATGDIVRNLQAINQAIDPYLIGIMRPGFKSPYTIRPLREIGSLPQ